MSSAQEKPGTQRLAFGVVAVSLLSYALCDLLHEAAHALATLLPLGVRALSISTVAVATTRSSPVVAAAGSLANLVFGSTLLLSYGRALPSPWRYFGWLFGSLNLFNATGYLLYSAVADSGDMAVVFRAIAPAPLWRPVTGLAGLGLYLAAVRLSRLGLQRLVDSGIVAAASIESCCMLPYWSGGLLLAAGAALNPESPWLILTSGVAVGFGAMAGLVLVAHRVLPTSPGEVREPSAPLEFTWPWLVSGFGAALVFIGVFGPGLRLPGG